MKLLTRTGGTCVKYFTLCEESCWNQRSTYIAKVELGCGLLLCSRQYFCMSWQASHLLTQYTTSVSLFEVFCVANDVCIWEFGQKSGSILSCNSRNFEVSHTEGISLNKFLTVVGQLQFRGTSVLFRLPKSPVRKGESDPYDRPPCPSPVHVHVVTAGKEAEKGERLSDEEMDTTEPMESPGGLCRGGEKRDRWGFP